MIPLGTDGLLDFSGGQFETVPQNDRVIEWFGLLKPTFGELDSRPILAFEVALEVINSVPGESRNFRTLPPHGFYGYCQPRKDGKPVGDKIRLEQKTSRLQFAIPENLVHEWAWCYHTAQQDAIRLSNPLVILTWTRAPVLPTLGFNELSFHFDKPWRVRLKSRFIVFAVQCSPVGLPNLVPSSVHPAEAGDQKGVEGDPIANALPNSPSYDGEGDNGETYEPEPPEPTIVNWRFCSDLIRSDGVNLGTGCIVTPGTPTDSFTQLREGASGDYVLRQISTTPEFDKELSRFNPGTSTIENQRFEIVP